MKNIITRAGVAILTASAYTYVSATMALASSDTPPPPPPPPTGVQDATGALGNLQQVGVGAYGQAATQQTLQGSIAIMIRSALSLIGIILVVIVIYAGFTWMTAGGNEEKVTKAKKWLTNAVIGIVITMLAYGIAEFVLTAVLKGTS